MLRIGSLIMKIHKTVSLDPILYKLSYRNNNVHIYIKTMIALEIKKDWGDFKSFSQKFLDCVLRF